MHRQPFRGLITNGRVHTSVEKRWKIMIFSVSVNMSIAVLKVIEKIVNHAQDV